MTTTIRKDGAPTRSRAELLEYLTTWIDASTWPAVSADDLREIVAALTGRPSIEQIEDLAVRCGLVGKGIHDKVIEFADLVREAEPLPPGALARSAPLVDGRQDALYPGYVLPTGSQVHPDMALPSIPSSGTNAAQDSSADFHFPQSAPVSTPTNAAEQCETPTAANADGLSFAVEALELCATWIEGITPEQLELWRESKVAEIRRDLRKLSTNRTPAEKAGGLSGEASRQNMELVIARLEQISGNFSTDYREDAAQALVCARAVRAKLTDSPTAADAVVQEPEHMNTQSSREYLVKFMEQHFTDKTFHRYIRGEATRNHLAGDFAWQLARALRMLPTTAVGAVGRVYTYANQPQNGPAWQFGEAATLTMKKPGGDWIDTGLQLLLELQNKGYGIVEVPGLTRPTANGAGGQHG
jgi:hypothetical protein